MMPMPDIYDLAVAIHKENEKWWTDLETGEPNRPPRGQKEMLMISEVAEAMEGLRKGLKDDKLPHRPMAEVEAADYVIRVLDFAAAIHAIPYMGDEPLKRYHRTEYEMLLAMCRAAWDLYDADIDSITDDVRRCINAARTFCQEMGYDLWAAVEEKRAFNRERPDHKIENRMKEGGKKW